MLQHSDIVTKGGIQCGSKELDDQTLSTLFKFCKLIFLGSAHLFYNKGVVDIGGGGKEEQNNFACFERKSQPVILCSKGTRTMGRDAFR